MCDGNFDCPDEDDELNCQGSMSLKNYRYVDTGLDLKFISKSDQLKYYISIYYIFGVCSYVTNLPRGQYYFVLL